MAGEEWTLDKPKVRRYLGRADEFPHRAEGESVLLDHVPRDARRILDLGTGDGRLLTLLQVDRPEMHGVGFDFSDLMLGAARKRFAGDDRIELVKHDLAKPLPALGRFDAVVSSFAIHHLEHERKRMLYGEVFDLLEPGGVFANFEHVASATHRLHLAFFEAIEEPIANEDPSDRLLDVETQLRWLRELGFDDVDCYWKWLEMALLVGVKPFGDEPIRIVPYDQTWPARFEEERVKLEEAIGRWIVGGIHHVGSTAVSGLDAKPIIDILVGVEDLESSRACFDLLAGLGYLYAPYRSEEMHWFCKPDPSHRTYHLHLVPVGSPRYEEELAFRDRLRADPTFADEYADLKRSLASRFRDDREAYTDAKAEFIHRTLNGE